MAELIDKWDAVNKLIALENEFQHYKPFHGFEHAMYRKICEAEIAIGKTPGLEVIHCENCTHGDPEDCPDGRVWCTRMCRYMEFDGFCSFGDPRK